MTNSNEVIKRQRMLLNLQAPWVAQQCGLSISEYEDIEDYPDEILSVTRLSEIRKLSKVLGLSIFEILKINSTSSNTDKYDDIFSKTRCEIIIQKRRELGLTRDQLANKLGFYERAVIDMEDDNDFLENWSFELINNLSIKLSIPLEMLLKKQCFNE